MKHLFCILIFLAFLGKSTTLYSQGCSDAGVCSVGALGIVKVKMQKLPLVEFKLDLIKILTKATQKDMKNVALIEGYDGINGYTYQSMTYKFLLGNRGEPCEDKIKFGQEYDDLPEDRKLLWKWEEL